MGKIGKRGRMKGRGKMEEKTAALEGGVIEEGGENQEVKDGVKEARNTRGNIKVQKLVNGGGKF